MRSAAMAGMVAVVLALGSGGVQAQGVPAVQPPTDGVVDLAPVVVSGVQPGPGMWKVTAANGHVLWILGTVSPLPAKLEWRADEVRAVIAEADQVLTAPGWKVDADVGFFGKLALVPSAMKAAHDPQGRRLEEILPAPLYARWLPLKQQYLGRDRGVEKDRPLVAAMRLYAKALDSVGLGRGTAVTKVLEKAYKEHGLTPVPTQVVVKVDDPRQALKDIRRSTLSDEACFARTLDMVEQQLPRLVERANAWSMGDIDALQRLAVDSQYDACAGAIAGSDFGRQRGLGNMQARAAEQWMQTAGAALARNRTTFAVVPVQVLLAPGGYLQRLERAGHQVEQP